MKWIALFTAGCFAVLAAFSIGRWHPDAKPHAVGYSVEARAEMAALIESLDGPQGVVYDSRVRAIADIWNITPENENAYEEWFK